MSSLDAQAPAVTEADDAGLTRTVAAATAALVALACVLQHGLGAFFAPSRTVGMGDAKLALLVGLGLGGDALLGFFVTSFAAGGYALALILLRGSEARNEGLPFGPFLAIGAAVALVVGGGSLYA
jgi:leader peptidase (prepilin peptidase)/N-methyltransferase